MVELIMEEKSKEFKLEILSPLDKKEDKRVKKYLKHLKDAVDNIEVKNLALSGVYGSGKSTIIKSFQSLYPNLQLLHISLASFKEIKDGDYEKFKDQIQLNILQQIIYSQKADKLPESRIKRINEIDIWDRQNWLKVLAFLGISISTYLLIKFYQFEINPNNWKKSLDFSFSCFTLLIISFLSMIPIGEIVIEIVKNLKVNKLNLTELDLGNKNENKEILNSHIDEIIYFFEKIKVDIVVIEDLDRFNSTEIYRTLRELNFILNNYLKNLNKEKFNKITFLYAIKDELFLNELDRTKFFDLIIPAIPFVNYSNSKNVLKTKLNEIFNDEVVLKKPSKEFINTVSTFIIDNRILLNIINEFVIYKEQQKLYNEELNSEKLLALIIYKNLRPKDFSRLHSFKSNVDIIFNNKQKMIEVSINSKNIDINRKLEEIEKIKKENLKGIKDLNTIYLYYIKEAINDNSAVGLMLNSTKKTFSQIIDQAIDLNQLYTEKNLYYSNYNNQFDTNFKLDKIDSKYGFKYSEKYDLIINKNKFIVEKESEIKKLKDEIFDIKNESLEKILKKKDLSKEKLKEEFDKFYLESESEIEEKERAYNDSLLIFLIENGYIDEHYKEYISTFQKGGLNESDHEFKINIISKIHKPKPIDYELNDIKDIVEELPTSYFRENRILNIQILDFLIDNKIIYKEKLESIFKIISEWDSERTKELFSAYIHKGSKREKFIIELVKSCNELWSIVSSDSILIKDDKKQILHILLNNADDHTLKSLNGGKALSNFISENIDVLFEFVSDSQLKRVNEILSDKVIDVKFKELIPLPDNFKKLFSLIYENNRYEINTNNIGTFIEQKFDTEFNFESFNNSNLTYIYESELDRLIEYIENDDFKLYIENVYSQLENEQFDNEDYVLKVLNNEDLSIEMKSVFLKKQSNSIIDITKLETIELYDLVIKENKINANWDNIYQYYYEYDNVFNEELTNFININYFNLRGHLIDSNIDHEMINEFTQNLISNDKLTTDAYQEIINFCIDKKFVLQENYDFKIISKEKVNVLIDFNKVVTLNKTNFEHIKSIFPNLHIKLLLRNWEDYLNYYDDHEIVTDDKLLILQEDFLDDNSMRKIIKDHISESDLDNEELVMEVIRLVLHYSESQKKNELINVLKLKKLIFHALDIKDKIKLINLLNGKLTKIDIIEIQSQLPNEYKLSPKGILMLENNEWNSNYVALLQSLKIAGTSKLEKSNKIKVWLNDYTKNL
jgi:hypothetical protein